MIRSLCLVLLALMIFLPVAAVAVPVFGEAGPVPEGARVTLELDKVEYFLGENILVHFRLENVGDKPFSYSYGGDYRGGSRSARFKFSAIVPDGQPVADPDPSGFNEGGLWQTIVLKPGERVYWSLPLIRYCLFDKPGRYTLKIRHDFGWTETPKRKYPVGEIGLTLKMPTPAQARRVLQEMDTPPTPSRGWGEKSAPYADFSALRYSVYLPLLRARAQGKTPKEFETALQGIGSIPTPEATLALVELASDPDPSRAVPAAQVLNGRLPDPALSGKLIPRSPFRDPRASSRSVLSRSAWRAQFAPLARSIARKLVASPDPGTVITAAYVLECIGTVDDFPVLTSALETAIQRTPPIPVFDGSYPRSYGACAELERATLMRLQTGAQVTAPLRTAAEQDEYLQALTAQPSHRPPDWPEQCLSLLDSPVPYLRARTLATLVTLSPLPLPLTDTLRQRLPALLLDRNEDIQVAACAMAQKFKDPTLLAPVLQALRNARDFPLPNDLTNAAVYQGGRWEALNFWADHLDDPTRKMDALGFVQRILDPRSIGGYDSNYDAATGAALKSEWVKFLLAHRQEIEAGKTYSREIPEVQALFPRKIFMFGGGVF